MLVDCHPSSPAYPFPKSKMDYYMCAQTQDLLHNPISKQFNCLFFPSFHIQALSYLSRHLFLAHFYSSPLMLCACCVSVSVTDTVSTRTVTEPPSVECQDLLIPTRLNACVARKDLSLKSHLNNWAMRYKLIAQGDYTITNRNRVFCYHQLCPGDGESNLSAKRHRNRRLAPTL